MKSFEKKKLKELAKQIKHLKCDLKEAQRVATFKSIDVDDVCQGCPWSFLGEYQPGFRYAASDITKTWRQVDDIIDKLFDLQKRFRELHVYSSLCRGKSIEEIEPNRDATHYHTIVFDTQYKKWFNHAIKRANYNKLVHMPL